MKRYRGTIRTDRVGSNCEFEFEVNDDADEDEIERIAKEEAFDFVEWEYHEI